MDKRESVFGQIIEQGILPLYFHPDAGVSWLVLQALYNAGLRAVEYTNRGETALENFSHLANSAVKKLPGLMLGAGTIKNKTDASAFINAGADFIVCPGMMEEVGNFVHGHDLLWIPGCMTTTEIICAEECNAKLIKIFPGSLLGPAYVTAIKEIFPNLLFMPTGGVDLTEENIGGWFDAGVAAVGLGSKLISSELLEQKNYSEIELQAKKVMGVVQKIKQDKT
ncbi:MAG: bifunctional 4-hydroxy-2-oxoglutarate aldolase/2-dehydro-3-deoxy-phosphogluconate aldolase [Ginsengibacter sp.]